MIRHNPLSMTNLPTLLWSMGLVFLFSFAGCQCGAPGEPQTDASVSTEQEDRDASSTGCPPGQHDDGNGGCTSSKCQPDPCTQQANTECVEENDTFSCRCKAGTHKEGDACVQDQECKPNSCRGHGTCSLEEGIVKCKCETGYKGEYCDSCDKENGYFPNGSGDCKQNLCEPNPCKEPGRNLCRMENGKAQCLCNAGTHDDNGQCVPDQTCKANTCNGHGVCEDSNKKVTCRCNQGYKGTFCDKCDEANGYHPDGSGGCTDDPCLPNPCKQTNKTSCQVKNKQAQCLCDAGYHDKNGQCVKDQVCQSNTCNGHGTCQVQGGVVSCKCNPGFQGKSCNNCDKAAGYHPDGRGSCTNDPCTPNPCKTTNKTVCKANSGKAECSCDPGTHDENGKCVIDRKCEANTCNGHGTCTATNGVISCKCNKGFTGAFCKDCDKANNYHSDGKGGCTQDPCTPNPCKQANQTVCKATGLQHQCLCVAGYHLDNNACVKDEVCTSQTCNGKGQCSVVSGKTQCKCNAGYMGAACKNCDTAKGYHSDGKGGCTNDPCLPNPCKQTNKTQCKKATTGKAQCFCDTGYHDDGTGGCTQDPCLPNPCTAQNKACRNKNGKAECYTPTCNDNNPCTTDTLKAGKCEYTKLPDNTACSTTLCKKQQTCLAGVCQGGQTTVCDDKNPCTRNSCDPIKGCQYTNDNTLTPDDGYTCTVDTCNQGVATHTKDDSRCDDKLYCTGVETCNPKDSKADAQGCVATQVPQKPADPGPCATYGTCDEATKSFPLNKKAPGASCDDGIPCTQQDKCNAQGACAGTPTPQCGVVTSCQSTQPFGTTLNIPVARITGKMTMGGQALPAKNGNYDGAAFYLKAKDTGAAHYLAGYSYRYVSSGNYSLRGDTYDSKVIPGVYDLLYRRKWDSTYNTVTITSGTSSQLNGYRILKENVVITRGTNTLNLDIPVARITGKMTMGGLPLPAKNGNYDGAAFYLKAKDTSAAHYLAGFSYRYVSSGNYALRGDTYDSKIIPGTYDLLYRRKWDSTYNTVTVTSGTSAQLNGYRILKENVVISTGAQTLNLDIPVARITGKMTMGSQALPAKNGNYDGAAFYLKAKDTGAAHYLAGFSYRYVSSGNYALRSDTYDSKIIPGTYDLLYRRKWDSTYNTVTITSGTSSQLNGYRILQSNVVIKPGAQTLNLDIPVGRITGKMTMGGQALPAKNGNYDGAAFYLKAKDTGAAHYLAGFSYRYVSSGNYALRSDAYDSKIIPGTYDLLYRRKWDSKYNTVTITSGTSSQLNGYRILQSNVVIKSGNQTLNLDIPVARITGKMTMGGQALPAKNGNYDGAAFYLKAKDTGAAHYLAGFSYRYVSSGNYALRSDTYDSKLIPGTYDLLYRRKWDSTYNTVTITSGTSSQLNGYRILQSNVVIKPGSQTLNFDIPVARLTGKMTMDGGPLPAKNGNYDGAAFYLRALDTGAAHYLAGYSYRYVSSGNYALRSDAYDSKIIPGKYQLLYRRKWDSKYNTVTITSGTSAQINGYRYLQVCVEVK